MTIRHLRTIGAFAAGVAVTAGAIAISVGLPAVAAPGPAESTFVPITPCRLFDTRAGADNVGPRDTPIRQQPLIQQVTGINGNCTIPADATAVALNVTAVNASTTSFLQLHPADVTRPLGSNLNLRVGQAPTPNKVDVKLSATGAVAVFNNAGTVDVLADVMGYYTSKGLQELAADVAAQPTTFTAVIEGNGTLARGIGTIRALRQSNGVYLVDFPVDVSGCVYTASPGTSVSGTASNKIASVAPSIAAAEQVLVRTQSASDPITNVDSGFHLIVVCSPT